MKINEVVAKIKPRICLNEKCKHKFTVRQDTEKIRCPRCKSDSMPSFLKNEIVQKYRKF